MPADSWWGTRRRNRGQITQSLPDTPLSTCLEDNLQAVKRAMGESDDLVLREFRLGTEGTINAAVIFVSGLIDVGVVDNFVLRSLGAESGKTGGQAGDASLLHIKERVLDSAEVTEATALNQVLSGILSGSTAILVDGQALALLAVTVGWKNRQVTESTVEGVVRGSREAFTEDLATSIAAVRKRIRNPSLRVQKLTLGKVTQTRVAIMYLDGVAKPEIIREVQSRIARIEIDGILESGYIEELIEDSPWSPFPQIGHTEKPDKVAANLLEGHVAIVTDGTPVVLLAPFRFVQLLQSPDDYYERWPIGLFIRGLRILGLVAALYLPALYVAAITYHQEMIPLGLALNIAGTREGAPFPAFVEALLMEVTFELLREAGMRLPRPVGQAISIVGGLVIGESAVRAGLVGAPMVIVVAFTGTASFTIPAFDLALALRAMRFPIMAIGAVVGLPGITVSGLVILCHLAALRSFGVPYLSPLAPGNVKDWKDVPVRAPWWAMKRRPSETTVGDQRLKPRSRRWPPR